MTEFADSNTVYVPLSGIKLDMQNINDIPIGNATICQLFDEEEDDLRNKYWDAFEACSGIIGDDLFHGLFPDEIHSYLAFRVPLDPNFRYKDVLIDAQQIIELLRYGVSLLNERDNYEEHIIYLSPPQEVQGRIISDALPDRKWFDNREWEWFDNIKPILTLGIDDINVMIDAGVMRMAEVINVPNQSEFERVIFRGIHWLSSAHIQTHKETRLVNLVTALEVLLGPSDREERIANSIAESAAILLAICVDDRIEHKKRVKKYYDLRSKVVHGGGQKEIPKETLRELTYTVALVIKYLITHKDNFHTKKEFLNWMERMRLSASMVM